MPERNAQGFDAMLAYADQLGFDTADMRCKVAHWVATGSCR